jgi:methyltransferase-like protein/trans-aconitate methyltransferase
MDASDLTAYDTVRYLSRPFAQTHPDRLATMAAWFGMHPAPVEQCRLLELGCGSGANIIPMALGLPESYFVGVDLARTPIAEGKAVISELGLPHVELRALDLRALPVDLGQFDYIVAHGLYSWVAPEVQEQILATCAERLAPQGVAYVSYNAYPGCHIREMVREMMLFHIRDVEDPEERLSQALDFVQLLAAGIAGDYAEFLRQELDDLLEWRREYVFHDDLAPFSEPLYFAQFMERAQRHGLQYLAEANIFDMQDRNFPPAVREYLRRVEAARGLLEKEQYLDFLKNRRFRQTLLCHQDVVPVRARPHEAVKQFWIASPAEPESDAPDYRSRTVEVFNGPKGSSMQTDQPLAKSAIVYLGQIWPERVRFETLREQARSMAGVTDAGEDQFLLETLQQSFWAGLVELHMHAPRLVGRVGPRPEASPLARLEAHTRSMVTTLLHSSVQLDGAAARYALQLMDGSRDRATLAEALDAWARDRGLQQIEGDLLSDALEQNLGKMARLGLMLA